MVEASLSDNNLQSHVKSFHPEKLKVWFQCKICELKFSKPKYLKMHLNKKHPNGIWVPFECDFCGKIFKNKKKILGHLIMHLPPIKCQICCAKLKQGSMFQHLNQFRQKISVLNLLKILQIRKSIKMS